MSSIWSSAGAEYNAVDVRPLRSSTVMPPLGRFLVMDARHMDLPAESFDLVICNNVLPFVVEAKIMLTEMRRVLKPEGLMIATVHRIPGPTVSSAEYQRQHPQECTPEYLAENGSEWFFGDDYGSILRGLGLESSDIEPNAGTEAETLDMMGLKKKTLLTLAAREPRVLEAWLGGAQ
jgi:SAM-dependent methyltransferase